MARYRIEFSREWLRGRWGYIDRIFHKLGGKESEPSRTDDSWLVEFKGKPRELGAYLSERLELKDKDFRQFGSIFEITEVPSPGEPSSRESGAAIPARRLGAPSY